MRLAALLVLVLLLATCERAAGAIRPLTPMDPKTAPEATDGVRWGATIDGDDVVLTDARDGSVARIPGATGCSVADLDRGRVLLGCDNPNAGNPYECTGAPEDLPRIVLARERRIFTPPGADVANGCAAYYGIGSQWLAGPVTCYHCNAQAYLDWRTGRTVVDGSTDAATTLPERDLDDPELRAIRPRLYDATCTGAGTGIAYAVYGYVRTQPLILCRNHRPTVLSRCDPYCGQVRFDNGRITWSTARRTIRGYDLRTRRHSTWPFPASFKIDDIVGISATRYRIYVRGRAPDHASDTPVFEGVWPPAG